MVNFRPQEVLEVANGGLPGLQIPELAFRSRQRHLGWQETELDAEPLTLDGCPILSISQYISSACWSHTLALHEMYGFCFLPRMDPKEIPKHLRPSCRTYHLFKGLIDSPRYDRVQKNMVPQWWIVIFPIKKSQKWRHIPASDRPIYHRIVADMHIHWILLSLFWTKTPTIDTHHFQTHHPSNSFPPTGHLWLEPAVMKWYVRACASDERGDTWGHMEKSWPEKWGILDVPSNGTLIFWFFLRSGKSSCFYLGIVKMLGKTKRSSFSR